MSRNASVMVKKNFAGLMQGLHNQAPCMQLMDDYSIPVTL